MTSLSKNARVAGLLYILASVVGVVRLLYIPSALIVHGNAAATVNNIAAHELLFRLSIVSYLLSSVLFTFLTLALYRLFKGVDVGLAVLMVILGGLMPVPIFFVNSVTDVAVLLFARGADMTDLHVFYVANFLSRLAGPQTQIGLLAIHEELRIEPAKLFEYLASNDHARPDDPGDFPRQR